MEQTFAVGVDLGGTNLKAALVEQHAGIVFRASVDSEAEHGPDRVLDCIAEGIAQVAAQLPEGARLAGIGIGAPGSISLDRATVRHPPNFPGWGVVHLPEEITRRLAPRGLPLDGPIFVENDANVAGLGSAFYGAGVPYPSFVMVTLGTGVGGAIIVENRLFRGSTGAAGEIGHVSIDYEGPFSRAGVAGAVEAYLGQRYLSRHARYQLMARDTPLRETSGPDMLDLTPHLLHEAALRGDVPAREVLAWAGHKLGVMLGSVVNLLDIRTVIVGGGVSQAGDFILGPAREALLRQVMPGMREGVQILQETRGNDVALLGAARMVFEHHEDLDA
jgi:glucokinase